MKRNLAGLVQRGLRQASSDREHPIERLVLRSAGLTRQPTDAQIDEIANAVGRGLAPLLGVAMSGNVHAIRRVTEMASQLCAEATALACMHQEAADVVARERTTWPLDISHDPKERRRSLRLVSGPRRLPLGNPPPPAVQPAAKRGGYSSPARTAVLVALKMIEVERSFRIPSELFPALQPAWSAAAEQLPELQSATAEAWFKVIWIYICDRHAGTPEQSDLRRLVAPDEQNVRAALRSTLKQTFLQLVRGRRSRRRRAPSAVRGKNSEKSGSR